MQVAGLVTFPPQPNYIPLTTGLLAVTGGDALIEGCEDMGEVPLLVPLQ